MYQSRVDLSGFSAKYAHAWLPKTHRVYRTIESTDEVYNRLYEFASHLLYGTLQARVNTRSFLRAYYSAPLASRKNTSGNPIKGNRARRQQARTVTAKRTGGQRHPRISERRSAAKYAENRRHVDQGPKPLSRSDMGAHRQARFSTARQALQAQWETVLPRH
jgi:hypothetical protein